MSTVTTTRFVNRWKPVEFINIETGVLTTGPIQPGWLSAQWVIEPVSGTPFVRFKNLWKPDNHLHVENGFPEAGLIQPGWLSALWQFEEVPGTAYVRIRSRLRLIRYAHIQFGQIDVGQVAPGWFSAQWLLEKVQGTSFVRLRNRWQPDQCLHIETGVLSAGPIEPGWLSAQWSVEKISGTSFVRFKNRLKPNPGFHIENGRAEAGPIQPGWLSAQWLVEPVSGTDFVRLRNRWELDRYLHIERGILEAGAIAPGWLSAQWLRASQAGSIRSKVVPLDLFERKFDEFVNQRERPLFKFRLHGREFGKSELTTFFENPVTGELTEFGEPVDLRDDGKDLEIDVPGPFNPNYNFNDLNTDRVTLNIRAQPAGVPPEIEAQVHFETAGEELKINNFFNINFTGLKLVLKLRLMLDAANGLVQLATDKQPVSTDASVDVAGLPDGVVAREIEDTLNAKVLKALQERLHDKQEEPGVIQPGINRRLTRSLVGGDYQVARAESDGQGLTIEYLDSNQIDPFPENPQPPLNPGRLSNIHHIVVLMMENRSFDHMLGYLSKHGGRADVDGLRGGEKNRFKGLDRFSFPLADTQFIEGPCHDFECVANQVNGGKMDGFVADFAARFESSGTDPGKVMGYYQAAHVPVYDVLAREFLLCQRWFCSHPGPTFPNRFYLTTGRLSRDASGRNELDNPKISDFAPLSTKTIFDHLTDQNVTWHYYEHGYCFLRLFERYTVDNKFIIDAHDPARGFFAAAKAGTLPSVSFVDPDFIDVPPGNDDHPPADIAAGQRLIAEVVRALMSGPLWSKTLLVITYDEHGGFFDHVPPPKAPPVSGIDVYGPRVPTFVVSPWVERGRVTDIVFDHTSILKTIARRFLSARPPDMGERVAAANDLSMVLSSTAREDKPAIPLPPLPPVSAIARAAALRPESERDFHALLRSMSFQFSMR